MSRDKLDESSSCYSLNLPRLYKVQASLTFVTLLLVMRHVKFPLIDVKRVCHAGEAEQKEQLQDVEDQDVS